MRFQGSDIGGAFALVIALMLAACGPSSTATPVAMLASSTATPTSTATPMPTATSTPTSTATDTPTPTLTPAPTQTPTPSPTATDTFTPQPAATPTITPTPTSKPFGPKKIAADPPKGFHWPYLLYAPSSVQSKHIFVVPNNTGNRDDDFSVHESSAKRTMYSMTAWADALGVALLVPIFPRFDDETDGTIASQYLGRGTLEEYWQQNYPKLARQDLQLLAMIDHARGQLGSIGIKTDGKILMWGYSASGMFVSRFIILHPEAVRAATFGGHGWTTAPVAEWRGLDLPYPYGVGDLEQLTGDRFNLEMLRNVDVYVFMGAEDNNGWALPWYIGDHDRGAFHESFVSAFGFSAASLSATSDQIYTQTGCSATFVLYQGADHQITSQMDRDALEFLRTHKD